MFLSCNGELVGEADVGDSSVLLSEPAAAASITPSGNSPAARAAAAAVRDGGRERDLRTRSGRLDDVDGMVSGTESRRSKGMLEGPDEEGGI